MNIGTTTDKSQVLAVSSVRAQPCLLEDQHPSCWLNLGLSPVE